jgi:DNA-binding transcriptional LysR family regulator
MTLDQLRVFVAIAERGHVTRAAEALHMAQSAASAAIASLEARHGIKLFHRVGRGIELTGAGRLFLGEAKAVLARAELASLTLEELAGRKRGRLSIEASQTIASYWLPRHLVAFHGAFPGIEIRSGVGNTAQVAFAVHEGRAELGFVEGDVEDSLLASRVVARDQLVIVVGREHPWASLGRLEAAALADAEWVLREPGSGTRAMFESAIGGFGISASRLNVVLELPSNEAVRGAVEAGLGATAISASVAGPAIEAGLLQKVGFSLPERDFRVMWHGDRARSPAAEAFLALLPALQSI